jgi:uncharacterized caspase-like protein
LFSGCKATPVDVPKGSSRELDVRKDQPDTLRDKHSFKNRETEPVEKLTPNKPTKDSAKMPDKVKQPPVPKPSENDYKYASNEKRLALIIGNSDYPHGGDLDNPVNDARAMNRSLKNLGFDVIKYENTGQIDMKKAIDIFGTKLKNYDVGLFFYAGHGVQVKGNNYLIPSDADLKSENDAEYNCVDAGRVLAKMEDAGSGTNIIILDACRDNPFERSWRRSAKGNGLASMTAPSGSLIAYATSPGSTASDGEEGGSNGLYTSALLQHIKTPNITILEMFRKVRVTVRGRTNKEQTPWESTSLIRNFYFKLEK